MKSKKWFIGYLKHGNNNELKYILIEEINNRSFREKIQRVYDYEYLQNLFKFIVRNLEDLKESLSALEVESKNDSDPNINNYYLEHHQTELQRTFFNLINSYSLSIDHIKHTFSSYEDKEEQHYQFLSKIASFYYDNFAGYKIIENLRNYCQHKNMPPLELIRDSEGNIQILITKEPLLEDNKIKNKIKLELESKNDFNFLYLTKGWFEAVQKIYLDYFYLFASYANDSSMFLLSYFSRIQDEIDRDNIELYLLAGYDENNIDQYSYLPTRTAIKIIDMIKKDNFKEKIDYISCFVEKYTKEQKENEEFLKKSKEYGVELPAFDTFAIDAMNQFLKR